MRPLPVKALRGAPAYVLGLTRARGLATVVVDANVLLGGGQASGGEVQRFVRLRTAGQPIVLAVEAVLGIRHVDLETMQAMPQGLGTHAASRAVGTLDGNVMLSLDVQQLLLDAGFASARGV